MRIKILSNPRTIFVIVVYCTQKRCLQIKPRLKVKMEDGQEAPLKPSMSYTILLVKIDLQINSTNCFIDQNKKFKSFELSSFVSSMWGPTKRPNYLKCTLFVKIRFAQNVILFLIPWTQGTPHLCLLMELISPHTLWFSHPFISASGCVVVL